MESTCATRAVKVLKYLRREVPATIPRSSIDALEELPSSVLAGLGTTSDLAEVIKDQRLRDWLASNAMPAPRDRASGPLLHGTLVFVQMVFQVAGEQPSAMSMADIQTARDYAALAVIPIHRYASQYGPNSIGVWPGIISFAANLASDVFTIWSFEPWVDQIAQIARDDKVSDPCVVVLHNRGLPNSPQFLGQRDSFHGITGNGTPFVYSLVFDENLNVADDNHTVNGVPNERVYAHNLSHEIAEMTVDPQADGSNPEVCDGCAGNCNNIWFDLFDSSGVFMGGTSDTGSVTGFAFFINSIVDENIALSSDSCIVATADAESGCVYPPPFVAGELLSYADDGTPGNVSAPVLVGIDGWLPFKFLFAGQNAAGANRIYAVNSNGELLSYGDDGAQGNVSDPVTVGFGGWLQFKFLFAGKNALGANRIYAVNSGGELLSYGDDGSPGNVSAPVTVGFGGWLQFKTLFAGQNALGANRIYAVNSDGQLLSYGDDGSPGNVSAPVTVGFGGWQDFTFLFAGQNAEGQNRIYAVNQSQNGQLLSYGDDGGPGNVSAPVTVGFDDWLDFRYLFAGRNLAGRSRIYAVPA